MPCPTSGGVQGGGYVHGRGWIFQGRGDYVEGAGYPPLPPWTWNQWGWVPPPLLTPSGCHHTDGWQAANTGQTGMLSCLSRYVPLPSLQKVEIRNFASKFQLKRSTLIHIGSPNTKQIWQGEQMTHVKQECIPVGCRTARLLTVSQHALMWGGVPAQGLRAQGVYLPRGRGCTHPGEGGLPARRGTCPGTPPPL